MDLRRDGRFLFFSDPAGKSAAGGLTAWLAQFRKYEWMVYAKPSFGGPKAVLA
jgi:hypothetical protein